MILVGGENLIDLIQLDEEGQEPVFQAKLGGSPFNTAKAIARQDAPVGYMAPISTDRMGDMLADDLKSNGVKLLAQRRSEPTSLAVVSLIEGTPSYQFYRNGTAERHVSPKTLAEQISKVSVEAFQLGSLAITGGEDADAWADFYVQMKTAGLFTSLDPNIRPAFIHDRDAFMDRFSKLLMNTDLLKLSDEDLEWLYPDHNISAAAEKLKAVTSAKLVVVTLGPDGAFALFDGQKISIKAAPVNGLKDTVGAGDTFMATLIATLYHDKKLSADALTQMTNENIHRLITRASRAAALNCERLGCNPPSREEIGD